MHTQYNTTKIKVNNLSSKLPETFPDIWDQSFSAKLADIGKANSVFFNCQKVLQRKYGRGRGDYLWEILGCCRRFGSGTFHHSDYEMAQLVGCSVNSIGLYKKYFIKEKLFHTYGAVKNRTTYVVINKAIKDVLSDELSILLHNKCESHIISKDHTPKRIFNNHDHNANDLLDSKLNNDELLNAAAEFEALRAQSTPKPSKPTKHTNKCNPEVLAKAEAINKPLTEKLVAINVNVQSIYDWLVGYGEHHVEKQLNIALANGRNPGGYLRTIFANNYAPSTNVVSIMAAPRYKNVSDWCMQWEKLSGDQRRELALKAAQFDCRIQPECYSREEVLQVLIWNGLEF